MTAEELRRRVHDDVGAPLDRPAQVRSCDRRVDDQRDAGTVGDCGEALEIGDDAGRVGDDFGVDQLRVRLHRGGEVGGLVAGDERGRDAEAGERSLEQRAGAAVQLGRRDDVVAGLAQRADDEELGRLPAGRRDRTDAAFEAGHPLLERGDGRVADAGVDVAELLQGEQVGRVGGVSRRRSWSSGRSAPPGRR